VLRLLLVPALLVPSLASASTYTVDIGGTVDELFIGSAWYGREGPYPQFGPVWHNAVCRWAQQGAEVRIPLFPGVANTIRMRADVRGDASQRMRWLLDGRPFAELPPSEALLYSAEAPADLVTDAPWGVLRIETDTASPVPGDARDLRVAVDWVEVSADAPARRFISEALAQAGLERGDVACDAAPRRWRFRYDPNDAGDAHAPQRFSELTYDDSAFELVPTGFLPRLRRGDAAWYRASVLIEAELDVVRRNLRMPGGKLAPGSRREVWINGMRLSSDDLGAAPLLDRAREQLSTGLNVLVVKLMQGPLPRPSGPAIVIRPPMRADWVKEGFRLSVGPVMLTQEHPGGREPILRLLGPGGEEVAQDAPEAGVHRWTVQGYGQHTLVIEDGQGGRQTFPVHFLGIHFFHWGWYIAGGGTSWNGFGPCSNDYLDQLFGRLGEWERPHHSISWCGGILRPDTGFHRTEGTDYVALHREALAEGQLDFVGMPFAPRNICTDFGESLVRGMRYSRELYASQLGVQPHRFYSHDATMTPQLPQLMRLCGYDTYCIAENWWGQGRSLPNSRDGYLRNPDGTEVRVLDSWYHGVGPVQAALRAAEQGKPAVLCNEEFACLDSTLFLEPAHLDALAEEGIFLKPVSADEYQAITEDFAGEFVYEGDDALCYKGWTGGGEREVEIEKLNRRLETRLVALENLVAFARWLQYEVPQEPIDALWELSLRLHECHLHWGNGFAPHEAQLTEALATADGEMARVGALIASKVSAGREGAAILNSLGFERSGLVRLQAPPGTQSLETGERRLPLQADPDDPALRMAAVTRLPSLGVRHYAFSDEPALRRGATATLDGESIALRNGLIGVRLSADGQISLLPGDGGTRRACDAMNRLWLAKPQGSGPDEPLSTEARPLNLAHYVRVESAGPPRLMAEGPVLAVAECDLRAPGYPGLSVALRVSLADHERQARVRLTLRFAEPTVVAPRGAKEPHEGCYFPGMFVDFPLPEGARPAADMAYCVTDGVLTSTNHETFMREPFRNGTFNALSMAAPNTAEYAVLTRGLPDFFALRRPEGRLGLSLGLGTEACPYRDTYVHEYALFAPGGAEPLAEAYLAAQAFLVEPVTVACGPHSGPLPTSVSFAAAEGRSAHIAGCQVEDGRVAMRVVNLSPRPSASRLTALFSLGHADVAPEGALAGGRMTLPPKAVREVTTNLR